MQAHLFLVALDGVVKGDIEADERRKEPHVRLGDARARQVPLGGEDGLDAIEARVQPVDARLRGIRPDGAVHRQHHFIVYEFVHLVDLIAELARVQVDGVLCVAARA